MLNERFFDTTITCNKCGRVIRAEIHVMTKKARAWYRVKMKFCGRCIQERLNRDNPDYDFHKEFSYEWNPTPMSKETEDAIKLLASCIM